jgi:hypothetical protein
MTNRASPLAEQCERRLKMKPLPKSLTDILATACKREDVAAWAQYCTGSCHGDWSPEAEAIYGEVMHNDEAFEFYRKTFETRFGTAQPEE